MKKKKQRIIHSIWIVESGRLKEIKPWGGGAYQREIASPRGERYYFLEDKKRALVIIVVREREREREEMWKS
jgi:putative component of toxin-antitoxin plasmid stabilization module